MTEQLFRTEVIEAKRDRLAGTVIAAVPPSSRLYTGLALFVAVSICLLLIFGSFAKTAQVRGIVAYDGGIARVFASSSGEVRSLHVQEGQRVEAGQPIATLALIQGVSGLAGQLAELTKQDNELAQQLALGSLSKTTDRSALVQKRANALDVIASLERQKAIVTQQIALAQTDVARAGRLSKQGAGTQRGIEASQASLLSRKSEAESLVERVIAQRDLIRDIDSQLNQKNVETERGKSVLTAQRAALAEQRAALLRSDQLVVTAPISGRLSDLNIQVGQRPKDQQSVATIVPDNSKQEVWIYAPTRAIGFAGAGQSVRLRFDAFPYQKFGVGLGSIIKVSNAPVDPVDLDPQLKIEEPVFKIRVRIDGMSSKIPQQEQSLRAGMTLDAGMVLERRRLWEIFLEPLLKVIRS
jgi:membrane fusion protein